MPIPQHHVKKKKVFSGEGKSMKGQELKAYTTPKLTVHGTVEQITKQKRAGTTDIFGGPEPS